ncbi:unnamed protein product [Gadus morhua 'NCC']
MTLLVVSAEDWLSSGTGVFTRLSSTQDLLGRDASEGGGGGVLKWLQTGEARGGGLWCSPLGVAGEQWPHCQWSTTLLSDEGHQEDGSPLIIHHSGRRRRRRRKKPLGMEGGLGQNSVTAGWGVKG